MSQDFGILPSLDGHTSRTVLAQPNAMASSTASKHIRGGPARTLFHFKYKHCAGQSAKYLANGKLLRNLR